MRKERKRQPAKTLERGKAETVRPKRGTWQTYDGTDGLPAGVLCPLQDRQGYLWLGTAAGLCRYDGAEFLTYTIADGLADNFVKAICEDHQGRLWLCNGWWSVTGRGVSCFDGECFITYTTADGLAHNRVRAVCEDRQGRLWFGTEGGVSRFDGECFITYTTADGLADNHVSAICEDRQGRLWFGTGEWNLSGRGVSCFDGQHFITYTTADGLADNHVSAICEDRQGRLWFGTWGSGVSCFDGQCFITDTTENGLLDNRVHGIIQDQEGLFWFAHGLSGLTRFDLETMQLLTVEPVTQILIQDREERLWFSNENELCCLFEGQQRRQTFNAPIFSCMEDSRRAFWVGTYGDGLYCYDSADAVWEGRDARHFTTEDGLGNNNIIDSLLEARDGTIWVGTERPGFLCRFDPAPLPPKFGGQGGADGKAFEAIPTPHSQVWRLFEDSRGRLWMGGYTGGWLSCYDVGAIHESPLHTYTMADGLPDDHVQSIVEDEAGHLWIGTQRGLCRFDGKQFTTYGKAQGLFSLFHQWSTKDVKGQLWFGTLMGGLYHYDGVHFQQLTTEDGLPSNSITGLVPQPDGSMIIGTLRGIVHYRPTATLPPRIEIREVVADKVYRNPTGLELTAMRGGDFHPSPPAPLPQWGEESRGGVPLLTISYHGMNFATHRMRYSYILEGYDADWQDTWENHVRYENLPVGEYTFKVIAINRDFVPSESPATLKLTIRPDPRDVVITVLQTEVNHLRREVGSKYHFDNLIGRSAPMKQVRAMMEKAIDSGLEVLITGETGTGKELVAKAIHYQSPRKDKPLKELNCGAVPKDLIASNLFGHRKGAFTGADQEHQGLFEAASGGTVLLDEIGEMPQEAQVHLLRVLQERKVQRLGEHQLREVDVRVIAMTNRNLAQDVKAGKFREDLYYRLLVFPIRVPALRERLEDIPQLAEHLLQKACLRLKVEIDGFGPGVIDMLQSYPWPGNIRQLENEIQRAAAFAEAGLRIQTYHFSPEVTRGESLIQEILSEQVGLSAAVKRFQQRMIEDVLRECGGNRTQAAKRLGMERPNLVALIKRLGIDSRET